MNKRRIFISLGSNTPDKQTKMHEAIESLTSDFDGIRFSEIYSTPCWRGAGPDYLNAVATFETDLDSETLNADFKHREVLGGRDSQKDSSGIVPLDIDLVIDDREIVRPRDFGRNYFRKGYYQLRDPREIRIEDFQYQLPDERIALHPLAERDRCKLLIYDNNDIIIDSRFDRIDHFLPSESLLIYNDTRVINARLRFVKDTGAEIEIFCLEPYLPNDYQLNFSSCEPVRWKCLVGNSKRWKGDALKMSVECRGKNITLSALRSDRIGSESIVEFSWDDSSISFSDIISAAGQLPIPPYLNRETEASDTDDYQTVYSRIEGSVAAPTAGLHFTDALLDRLRKDGIETRQVTLHVGAGTFRPVKSDVIGEHDMHAELIDVTRELIAELMETERPVTAVGTTTIRTLESLYHIGCRIATGTWTGNLDQWYPYEGEHPCLSRREALHAILNHLDKTGSDRLVTSTQIIIAPGYEFRMVDNLITNFHQPGSTLLLLIAAIVGDKWRNIYEHALSTGYRFLSYGDACLFKSLIRR